MTILREEEHRALSSLTISGSVADLGGDERSGYHQYIKGERTITSVNLDDKTKPDISADLEELLPLQNASFDGVFLMNVLEHIFNAQQLLRESARILTSGGKIVIAVPYLFPYHPSPNDYFRFSKTALERMLSEAGFVDIAIRPLGSGMFSARLLMFERLLPGSVQKLLALLTHPFVRLLDSLFTSFARSLRKKYDPSDYALGFLVTARHE